MFKRRSPKHRDFPTPWRREAFDRNGAIDTLIQSLTKVSALGRLSSWPDDWLTKSLLELSRFVDEIARREAIAERDYDGLEAELRGAARWRSWSWKGWRGTNFGGLSRDEVLARRDFAKSQLNSFIARSDADLAPLLHEAMQIPITEYGTRKAKLGRLDFLDLLIKTRDLIRDDAAVRSELQRRFTHFFVDEFQDTDPLQAEILLLLAADDSAQTDWRAVRPVPGKLFLVGDPKQAIYRFRRADVSVYEDVIAFWRNGEQAIANCLRIVDLARNFERRALSFRAFVETLEAEAERSEAGEAPIVEQGTEGVRIMTVHKAKGLEFPVVILADPTCKESSSTPSRHVDPGRQLWVQSVCGCAPIELLEAADEELRRDRAEGVRVAYVASTRARDLLVAPVCGDALIEGWLQVMDAMLYPQQDARRQSVPAPGCPAFGEDSVPDRGPEGLSPPGGSVRPGLHHLGVGAPDIVWWDSAVLPSEPEEHAPLRNQRVLEADAHGAAVASEANHTSWKQHRGRVIKQSSRPTLKVQTITSLARCVNERVGQNSLVREGGPNVLVEIIAGASSKRPGGKRFGALVHAVLASIELTGGNDVQKSASLNGRVIGSTDEEIEASIETVRAALQHPIIRRAASRRTDELRREMPVMMTLEDGSIAEGVVDLAFPDDTAGFAGWTIVDFKTDREFAASSESYVTQVRLYAEAIERVMRTPTQGVLLVV